MRSITMALSVALACMAYMSGASATTGGGVVHLDGPASLAELRATNPLHYARARKIIDAANELCRPEAGEVQYARFDARNISCARSLLRTSNPPKRELRFRLDDTQYIAWVTVTDDPAKPVAAAGKPR